MHRGREGVWVLSFSFKVSAICVPAQDNHGFVANAIIELQLKISENPTTGQ